jgi:hypothetical protein
MEGMPEFLYSCYLLYKNGIGRFGTLFPDPFNHIFTGIVLFGLGSGPLEKTI